MNVLIVYAHPEPTSLNGSIKNFAVTLLEKAGHKVQVSDLYAMNWKATLSPEDNTHPQSSPFNPSGSSKEAYQNGTQSQDIVEEQQKLRWADTLILQFPLWWFSMPAILKGWIDRVYAYGFAYGVGDYTDKRWSDRYGEGIFAGKKAMLVVSTGGRESNFSPRGVHGPIDDILFPIQHGMLFYPGFEVLPPFVIHHTHRIDEARYQTICQSFAKRLNTLEQTTPIQYRPQNGGDYLIPELTLREDILPGQQGLSIHIKQ